MTKKELSAPRGPSLRDRLAALPQYALPHHFLSACMHRLTRLRRPAIKNWQIATVIRRFGIDMSQAVEPDPHAYPDFNSFFTRALKPEMRPIAAAPEALASPVDATVSQLGDIEDGRIFQAKGRDYSLLELVGGEQPWADAFHGGSFATLYLAPRDYHRIHMPYEGRLRQMLHVPGRLFSVSPSTTRAVPRLFARNERVATLFDTPLGPMGVVMVGALFVGSIETVWAGVVTPGGRHLRRWNYAAQAPSFRRGEEIARFNMGSTVIMLLPPRKTRWQPSLASGTTVRMGQCLATSV